MAVRLAGAAVLARVEEGEQAAAGGPLLGALPLGQRGVGGVEIILLQQLGLRLVLFGGDDQVVADDGVLVQDEDVRGLLWAGHGGDKQVIGRRFERVELGLGRGIVIGGRWLTGGLLREGRAVAELELRRGRAVLGVVVLDNGGARSLACYMLCFVWRRLYLRTGTPEVVRITQTWVAEKVRLCFSAAAVNLASTRAGRGWSSWRKRMVEAGRRVRPARARSGRK